MNSSDPIQLIKALVGAELSSEHEMPFLEERRVRPVVTISREYGAGGSSVARLLADRLDVGVFDRELLEAAVASANTHHYLFERLDEQVQSRMSDWMNSIISGLGAFREDYKRHLIQVILAIGDRGGVIVGRGAHMILDERIAFRLRVTGSEETCARRVAKREKLGEEEALRKVHRMNTQRSEFLVALYGKRAAEPFRFDLVVNSDRYTPGEIAELTLAAMKAAGFPVPEPARTHA
jgi:cytidylate kinase